MGNFQLLLNGFATSITPQNLLFTLFGGLIGILVGAMPGIGSGAGVSLLLPITFKMNPVSAIIMLAGIYYGNMFGGAYSAILLNIPGDSPAVCTALDGYPMARMGKAGKALATANLSSFIGGTIGVLFLTIAGPALAEIGLKFGPAEIAALILFALTSISWLMGDDPIRCLISTGLGILVAMVGTDPATGKIRFAFGSINLLAGFQFIPLVIGMFGFSQVIELAVSKEKVDTASMTSISYKESFLTRKETFRILPTAVRSAILGNFIGFLPGAGGTTSAFLSYVTEKKIGKHKENIGKGEMCGVAASEAANNAAAVGSFVPLLGLGIPGSSTSAVLLGALMMWGLKPGPMLYSTNPDFVWSLNASMYVGNVICLIVGMAIIPLLCSILKVKSKTLAPIIMAICIVGAYSNNYNVFDVIVMVVSGLVAYYLKKCKIPVVSFILAFVLSPKLESSIRQAMGIAHGSVSIFVKKPISAFILALTVLMILYPTIKSAVAKRKKGN